MSYILDALQRADAERERGHVPGLRSQIVPPAGRGKSTPLRRWRPWHGAVIAASLLVAAGAWWWSSRSAQPQSPAEPVSAPPQLPPETPAAKAAVTADARTVTAPEPVLPILAPPRPEPPRPEPARPAKTDAAPAPAGATASAPAPTAATAPTNTASEVTTSPVPTFAELSPEARARLPAVSVSGSTYSRNPALRMLIVNGKVLQEGQEIAPGLKLETIGQRNAVLNHQGLRYSIGY